MVEKLMKEIYIPILPTSSPYSLVLWVFIVSCDFETNSCVRFISNDAVSANGNHTPIMQIKEWQVGRAPWHACFPQLSMFLFQGVNQGSGQYHTTSHSICVELMLTCRPKPQVMLINMPVL
jgi:hypothetical protein